jgi:hypothetical protein
MRSNLADHRRVAKVVGLGFNPLLEAFQGIMPGPIIVALKP